MGICSLPHLPVTPAGVEAEVAAGVVAKVEARVEARVEAKVEAVRSIASAQDG